MRRAYFDVCTTMLGLGLSACDVSVEPPDQGLMDWLQTISWVLGGIGALVAVGGVLLSARKFRLEFRAGREQREQELKQREQELRWKQADVGRQLKEDMLKRSAWDALQMLDNEGDEFEISPGNRVTIRHEDIRRALRRGIQDMRRKTSGAPLAGTDKYICKCFDDLFYVMDLFQHYTDRNLVSHEDISVPLDYFMPKLAKLREDVDDYLEAAEIGQAPAFLKNNYAPWKEVTISENTSTTT